MQSKNLFDIIIGLWQVADMERGGLKLDLEQASHAMLRYYENGFKTFDMADHYGSSEEIAGYFKQKYTLSDLKFFTKWVPEPGTINEPLTEAAICRALNRLKVDRIDLLQFHAWNYADPNWLNALYALSNLQKKGLIDKIGLTNFDHLHLNMVVQSGLAVSSNQISYSLLDQRAQDEMTQICLAHNISILAYGTVAGGYFSEKWLGMDEPKFSDNLTWSQMKYKRFIDAAGGWDWFQSMLSVLSKIAQQKNCSIATIASAFIGNAPAVGAVIIGARLSETSHIQEHKKIAALSFTEEERNEIGKILFQGQRIPGNCGDEYRKPPFLTASGDLSHHIKEFPKPYPVEKDQHGKETVFSGTPWEALAGYSRAIRIGNRVLVSGTTATHGDKIIGGKDPAAQTHFIIDKIEGALQSVGACLADVVRTRVFVSNIQQWESIARAHGARFAGIHPVNTMVEAALVGEGYLVEIEAEAMIK